MPEQYDYAKAAWKYRAHHVRYERFVNSLKLICQECGGSGGEVDVVLDDGTGPWEECGMCEGTGYLSPWMRGYWLRWRREEKLAKRSA